MKIGIQTWGSDGDILPFIALANGLRASGHDVTVVYTSVDNKDYSSYGENFDISLIKAYGRFAEEKAEIFAEIIETRDPVAQLSVILENYFVPAIGEMYKASKNLCNESDLVIGHGIHYPLATAAEKFKRPRISVALCPMTIESKYISPFNVNLGKWLNLLLWKFGDHLVRKKIYRAADKLRSEEGLPPFRNLQDDLYVTKILTLIATSEVLCPRKPDWGGNIQICGFLHPPKISADWEMPEELGKFLEAGEPPVYFTFGSCTRFDLEGTTQLLLDATRKSGVRAIIQSDWDNFSQVAEEPNIYKVQSIPHEYVFPHCSMIVHHGGAGTTQSSLQSGRPSVVVAHAFDQPFWGKKLHEIGVAGKVLSKRTITADKLAHSILATLNSSDIAKHAREIGQSVREEDGVGKAVSMIEERFR
jgi:sterol 3beta-glucosyltransferase